MARRAPHVLPVGANDPMDAIREQRPELLEYATTHIRAGVKADTQKVYQTRAAHVARSTGGLTFLHFLDFMKMHDEEAADGKAPRLRTTTLVQTKSAVVWVCSNYGVPWRDLEARLIGKVLKGRFAKDAPKRHRGQLTSDKVRKVMNLGLDRGRGEEAQGIAVIYGACCRPQDISTLTMLDLQDLDTEEPILWAKRKGTAEELIEKGGTTPNRIMWRVAVDILRNRVDALLNSDIPASELDEALLFPNFKDARARTLVQDAAKAFNFGEGVSWSGPHCARAGAARDAFRDVWEAVGSRGNWEAQSSCEIYGERRDDREARRQSGPYRVPRSTETADQEAIERAVASPREIKAMKAAEAAKLQAAEVKAATTGKAKAAVTKPATPSDPVKNMVKSNKSKINVKKKHAEKAAAAKKGAPKKTAAKGRAPRKAAAEKSKARGETARSAIAKGKAKAKGKRAK